MICQHCLRTVHAVTRDGVQVWADETNDPFYCPKALNLTHKPCLFDHGPTPCPECGGTL